MAVEMDVAARAGSAAPAVRAGWYSDPSDAERLRWWNGTAWTQDVRAIPSVSAASTTIETRPSSFLRSTADVVPRVGRGLVWTTGALWIASSPLWSVVPVAAVALVVDSPEPLVTVAIVVAGLIISLVVLLRLAMADRRLLVQGRYGSTASAWWSLLSPVVYLVLRNRQMRLWGDSGWGPIGWFIAASIASPLFVVVAYFVLLGLNPV